MKTEAAIRQALQRIKNMSAFAEKYTLPLRTLTRVKAGGAMRLGTKAVLSAALESEKA